MKRLAACLVVVVGCSSVTLPEGVFECDAEAQCPSDWFCHVNRRCYSYADSGPRDGGGGDAGGETDSGADAAAEDAGASDASSSLDAAHDGFSMGEGGVDAMVDAGNQDECTGSAKKCEGLRSFACTGGAWDQVETCPYLCSAGACLGGCSPGAARCLGSQAQSCDEAGAWQPEETCPYVCSGGACSGACIPNSTRCAGTTVQTCDTNGVWQNASSPCQYVCSGGACSGTCTPSSLRCSGLDAQSCDASGSWVTNQTCPFTCAGGSCSGTCTSDAQRCNGTVAQQCNGGTWATTQTCPYLCAAGVCTGSCSPGSTRCAGLNAETCDAGGSWQPTASCPFACMSGACTGVCTPGTSRCSGTSIQMCSSIGQWQSATACPSKANATAYCSAGVCTFDCDADYEDCDNSPGNGCEVSLQTNSANCNACGRACCGGGACSGGVCQPATIIPAGANQDFTSVHAVDGFDLDASYFYTAESDTARPSYTVTSSNIRRTARNSGAVTILAPTTQGTARSITAGGGNIYWRAVGTQWQLLSVSTGGGPTTVIEADGTTEVVRDNRDVFWGHGVGSSTDIRWRSLTSGAQGTTLPASVVTNNAFFVSDGTNLYFTEATDLQPTGQTCQGTGSGDRYSSTLKRVPVHGGVATLIASGCGTYIPRAVDGNNLYYQRSTSDVGGTGVYSVPLGGTASTKIGSSLGTPTVSDGMHLYFCSSGLKRMPVVGGAVNTLDGTCVTNIRLDGECVYYLAGTTALTTVNKVR